MNQPSDYDLPHDTWRPHQKEALDLILNMHNAQTLILEFPTGGGKSALSAAAGHEDRSLTMVATRDLQKQYADIYDFDVIWGRSHYPCIEEKKVKRWKDAYGFLPNAGDCTTMKKCSTWCPYKQAKGIASNSKKTVMNYHYSWYSEWWHKDEGYLFCDEAHNLAISTISNLAQLKVSEKQRIQWKLEKFPAASGTTLWAKDAVDKWLEQSVGMLGYTLGEMEDSKSKSKGTLLHRKLVLLRQLLYQGEWYVEGRNYGTVNNPPLLICRPINPSVFADRLLGHHSKRVLMSATIGDAEMLAKELGVEDYIFHTFPHNIPAENRPVYLVDSPAMSYKSTYKDYEKQADVISHICHQHKGERVLIHVTRWRHAHDLARRLARKGLQDRVWVPDPKHQGRIEQIAELTNPQYPDRIAIGPSFWEGLDLKPYSVAIIAKVPFQNRSDPVVAARLRQTGGGKWDRWCASLRIVQGCGRIVRDEKDYGVSYICDNAWGMVKKYAPAWFNVQT